ncbi:MAG TPA: UvrD-helicase domain-containing protein [Pseudomonadales bacterium]
MQAPDQAERDRATDIHRSVIVQAPAGSGKTSLLVQRYLKLLAVVDKPEEVLAITFTRKAASEMARRVLDALQAAAASSNPPRTPEAQSAAIAVARSTERGWRLLEQPARLKIQTIDSLAMSLTRGLPLAAGTDPTLALTETAAGLYRSAATRHLLRLYEDGPLTAEIADFLEQCGNDAGHAERLLAAMLAKRDQWLGVIRSVVTTHQQAPEQVADVLQAALRSLNDSVVSAFRESLGPHWCSELDDLVEYLAAGLGRDIRTDHARYRLAGELLTTQSGQLRRQVTKREGFPPEDRERKTRVMDLIAALAERDLAEQALNLRYLPAPELSPEAVRRLVNVSINLALATTELSAVFQAAGSTDFTTLILNAQAALGEADAPSELALALDYRIHHLLVDEFQDTSVSQFRLFERLLSGWSATDGNTFFAVGDPMQSIYRFRDADVSLFYRAWHQGIAEMPLERVVLTSNFRADARLVDWANHAFGRILGGGEDPVLGRIAYRGATATRNAAAADPAVTLFRYAEPADQAAGVVNHIETLLADEQGSIALLVRDRSHLRDVIRLLRERGISWHANDIDPLLNKPAVRDLLTLVTVLADPYDRLAWFSLLRAPFIGITLPDLQVLTDTTHFPTLLEAVASGERPAVSDSGASRLRRLANAWRLTAGLRHDLPPRSVAETLWLRLGGADAYPDPTALLHATRFLELMDSLGAKALIPEALSQAAVALYAADVTESRLQILTIHKSKGLEFDHVLVPFLERPPRHDDAELLLWRALPDGLLMGVKGDEGPHEWLARENMLRNRHERQRLFYVACTRACRSLTLFAAEGDQPKKASLFALLAPLVTNGVPSDMRMVDVDPQHTNPAAILGTGEPAAGNGAAPRLARLPDAYRWRPPPSADPAVQRIRGSTQTPDYLSAREEVTLGIVVHSTLERLASRALPTDVSAFIASQRPAWTRQAADPERTGGRSFTQEAALRIADAVAAQVAGVLGDPDGRRLLEARDSAHAEFAVTVVEQGAAQNLVIDRTFIEAGARWVVDYKTSVPPPDEDLDRFVREECARYRGQLARYGSAVAALFGGPIRLAIYFTAIPRLVELSGHSGGD